MIGVDEVAFECPKCEQRIAVPKDSSGSWMECPTCHEMISIPGQEWKGTVTKSAEVDRKLEERDLADHAGNVARVSYICFGMCGLGIALWMVLRANSQEEGTLAIYGCAGFFVLGCFVNLIAQLIRIQHWLARIANK